MSVSTNSRSIWQIIGIATAAFVLACFFFPWVEIGIKFLKTDMTGYQLAIGDGPAGISTKSWTILLLVPASMLLAILITLLTLTGLLSNEHAVRFSSMILILAGCMSIGAMIYQYFDMRDSLNENLLGVIARNMIRHLFGWGASIFASFLMATTGALDLYFRSVE